jgi:hypothetical protein
VHFLAERDAPSGASYIVWPFPEFPDRDERIVNALEERGTRLVLWNFTQFPNFPPVSEYAPVLYDYLVDRYEISRVFSYEAFGYDLAALRRSDPSAPRGTPVIPDGEAPGPVWIERRGRPPRPVAPERWGDYARLERWPFRPVLSLRPTAGGRTLLRASLRVPDGGARLRSAVGVHPKAWFRHPPSPVRFALEIESAGERERVYERVLNPHLVLEDRGWFDFEVPLDRWAGRDVVLRFSTATDNRDGEIAWMGGWGAPRVVTPAKPEEPHP